MLASHKPKILRVVSASAAKRANFESIRFVTYRRESMWLTVAQLCRVLVNNGERRRCGRTGDQR